MHKMDLQLFGGRGGSSSRGGGSNWKSQLRQMAERGAMPGYIMGDREQRAQVFKEIDRLYSMPQTNAHIEDQGTSVWVQLGNETFRSSYPSGEAASEAEKRGVLKMLLYNRLK